MSLLVEAGADAAGVDEFGRFSFAAGAFVVAEQECANAAHAGVPGAGQSIAADDEFLLKEALAFDPVGAAAGVVLCRSALGDDALGAELAGIAEDGGAVGFEVLGEAEDVRVGVGEELGEESFALAQRKVAGVVPVEMEEVEAEIGEWMFGVLLKRSLQVGEAGGSVRAENDDFAVEGDSVGGDARDLGGDGDGDGGHAMGPVEAGAGEQLD